jgi:hypothetical protein
MSPFGRARRLAAIVLLVAAAGCGSSHLIPFTDSVRMSYTGDELLETAVYVASDMELVSLRKGEIAGDDIFKREVKKVLRIERDTPGRVIRSGPDWVQVQFADSINITFVRNPSNRVYQTPGWGTINIGDERFDINMRVLAGKNIDLLVGRTREQE